MTGIMNDINCFSFLTNFSFYIYWANVKVFFSISANIGFAPLITIEFAKSKQNHMMVKSLHHLVLDLLEFHVISKVRCTISKIFDCHCNKFRSFNFFN